MAVTFTKKSGAKKHSATFSSVGEEIKTAVSSVVVKDKNGTQTVVNDEEAVVHGHGPFANVGVRLSRTINIGDYNSVKVEVSLNMPSVMVEPEIDEAFSFASGWVDQKMDELMQSVITDGDDGEKG